MPYLILAIGTFCIYYLVSDFENKRERERRKRRKHIIG
jgi:hypothetical protein